MIVWLLIDYSFLTAMETQPVSLKTLLAQKQKVSSPPGEVSMVRIIHFVYDISIKFMSDSAAPEYAGNRVLFAECICNKV